MHREYAEVVRARSFSQRAGLSSDKLGLWCLLHLFLLISHSHSHELIPTERGETGSYKHISEGEVVELQRCL